MSTTSARAMAAASVVAVRDPASMSGAIAAAGMPLVAWPPLMLATLAASTSSPVVWCPAEAIAVAVGSPAKPSPMTHTRLDGAGLTAFRSI